MQRLEDETRETGREESAQRMVWPHSSTCSACNRALPQGVKPMPLAKEPSMPHRVGRTSRRLQAGILGRLESTRLGRFIKRRQVDLDLSNNELGRLTGLSQTSVSNLRTGRCKSTLRLPALARALQVSVEELEELQELQELEDHAMTTRQTPQTRKSHQQSEDMN